MKRKSSLLLSIIGIAILFTLQQCTDGKSSFRKVLLQASEQVNKQCPMTVDSETRLDNTIVVGDDVIQYNYTLTEDTKETLDTTKLREAMIPIATNQIKTTPATETLRKHNTIFSYLYRDKNSAYAFSFSVTPEMYK